MKLKQRTVLLTGGTSGIGLEFAKQLLALGNTVLITGRNRDKLGKVHAELPGLHVFQSDATMADDITSLQRRVSADFPRVMY